jgi:hypothetical protein
MPQSDRFADTRPGPMRTVRGTLLTEATDALLRCTVLSTAWLDGADLQSAMGTSHATTTVQQAWAWWYVVTVLPFSGSLARLREVVAAGFSRVGDSVSGC